MFDKDLVVGISQDTKSKTPFECFIGRLLFVVERPYLDLDTYTIDNDIRVFIPREKIAYEFYASKENDGIISYYLFVVKEKLIKQGDIVAHRCMFYAESITEDDAIIGEIRKNYAATNAEIKIEKNTRNDNDAFCGYNVFINGKNIGFFSEFGKEDHFTKDCNGIMYFDFNACNNLIPMKKSRINTIDYLNEENKDRYRQVMKSCYPKYIYSLYSIFDYTLIGITSDEKVLLIKSNFPDSEENNGSYKYYEFFRKDFSFSKILVKDFGTHYTTFSSKYLKGIRVRDYQKFHPLCNMSFELLKGFTIDDNENMKDFYEILMIGGTMYKYRKIEKS